MLLAIDVGNSNMVLGVYQGDKLLHHWRLETKKERTSDEFGIFFQELLQFAKLPLDAIESIVISNVVPPLEFNLERMCDRYFKKKPLFINHKVKMPIKIGLDNPMEVGADRIVNASAGVLKYGSPIILIDFGTASTFDYISKNKVYQGGCIAPGISISNEALFQRASKLPRVEIKKTKSIIGRNTVESIQAGIFYGYVGMVDEVVRRIQKEARCKPKVIATGGFLSLIAPASQTITHTDPFLTLEGLRLLYGMNQKKTAPLKRVRKT